MENILLSWSGGKDCSMALFEELNGRKHSIASLLTTVTEGFERISMHGVRISLLDMQAASLGMRLEKVYIPQNSSNEEYDARMRRALEKHRTAGVASVAFGDLFLEDIRKYREGRLAEIGMHGLFPLWGRNTKELAEFFISHGFRAAICCVDPKKLPVSFCGMEYDADLLDSLPSGIDPCGENGEFHTFAYDGPIFSRRIPFHRGDTVIRDGFCFTDFLPD